MTALGVLCCFALFVCLTLLASFFLSSHLSFSNNYFLVVKIFYSFSFSTLRDSEYLCLGSVFGDQWRGDGWGVRVVRVEVRVRGHGIQ